MMSAEHEADPSQIDPREYLSRVNGDDTLQELFDHYQVLRPSLLRLQHENLPAFDLVVREITKRLKIKGKTILTDLAALVSPPVAKDAKELLEAMEQVQPLRVAQDFRAGVIEFHALPAPEQERVRVTLDQRALQSPQFRTLPEDERRKATDLILGRIPELATERQPGRRRDSRCSPHRHLRGWRTHRCRQSS